MKKLTASAAVAAIGLIWGTAAVAGTITAPTTTAKYAVESMTPSTDLTLPVITYRMGVDRTAAQDFTVIITPTAGAVFTAASCAAALPVVSLVVVLGTGPTGAITPSVKRASASECAYEIDVTTAFVRNDGVNTGHVDLSFTGLTFDSHTLNVAGTTAGVRVLLVDLGETAEIDNSTGRTGLAVNTALSGNALTMVAAADMLTQANVNDASGPLFGFVPQATVPADTATAAAAQYLIRNNFDGTNTWMRPDGTTPWNAQVDLAAGGIATTVTGNFGQLAPGGFTVATGAGTAPVATVVGMNATFAVLPANISGAAGTNTTVVTTFTTARTASMGTARTFGVSAIGNVTTGSAVVLAGNASWWTWSANASQLMTPYFTTNALFLSRFFLLNTGAGAVTYSADCFSETGNAITYGMGRTGTLTMSGLTAVNASSICTFAGAGRGAIIFTINAPINTVKGSYQYIDPVTLNGVVTPLTRPYNQALTTE